MNFVETVDKINELGFDVEIKAPSRREELNGQSRFTITAWHRDDEMRKRVKIECDNPNNGMRVLYDEIQNKFFNPM